MNKTQRHYEESTLVPATPAELFAYIDDHKQFSSHMSKSSWMMGGGKMDVFFDEGRGQKVGSHIRMGGTAFGIRLSLDEVVTRYEPSSAKTWKTVGIPRLLVIGSYTMGIEIKTQNNGSSLRVFIDYDLPITNAWMGKLFGGMYAKWCVQQMITGARDHFTNRKGVIHMAITDIFKKAAKKLDEAKDQVCDMKVDLGTTKFKSTYHGKVYGFCSEECKKTFDKNPFQYTDPNC